MKHLPLRECGYAIGVVALLLVTYGGAYLAIVEVPEFDDGTRSTIHFGDEPALFVVTYRLGGDWSRAFFAPAHELDRRLRPELWLFETSPPPMRLTVTHGVGVPRSAVEESP
jgi:hypothetical protein